MSYWQKKVEREATRLWSQKLVSVSTIFIILIMLSSCASKEQLAEMYKNMSDGMVKGISHELNYADLDKPAKTQLVDFSIDPKSKPVVHVINAQEGEENIGVSSNLKYQISMQDINELTVTYMKDRLRKSDFEVIDPDPDITMNLSLDKAGVYGYMGFKANVVLRVQIAEHDYNKVFDRTVGSGHFSKPIQVAFAATIHRAVQDVLEDPDFQNIIKTVN